MELETLEHTPNPLDTLTLPYRTVRFLFRTVRKDIAGYVPYATGTPKDIASYVPYGTLRKDIAISILVYYVI